MFSSQTAEHSLNAPCRCIAAVHGDETHHRFWVGTAKCRTENDDGGDNALHLLRFHEDLNELGTDLVLDHPTGEVLGLDPCPSDPRILLTSSSPTVVTLWKSPPPPEDDYDDDVEGDDRVMEQSRSSQPLERLIDLSVSPSHSIEDTSWNIPFEGSLELLSIERQMTGIDVGSVTLTTYDLDVSGEPIATHALPRMKNQPNGFETSMSLAVDPHHTGAVAVASGSAIATCDLRDPDGRGFEFSSLSTRRHMVTSLDYNPNRPHALVTGAEDGLVKFWDLRYLSSSGRSRPLLSCRGGHAHWITSVSYNPFHDQLILSAGTDAVVNLWRISSISSSPLLELGYGEGEVMDDDEDDDVGANNVNEDGYDPAERSTANEGPDVRVSRTEHQESVYDVSWSKTDAWVYASVGYDGNVVLSHVPSKEKYKILL